MGETQLLEGILAQTRLQSFPAIAFCQNDAAGAGNTAAGGEKEAVGIAFLSHSMWAGIARSTSSSGFIYVKTTT